MHTFRWLMPGLLVWMACAAPQPSSGQAAQPLADTMTTTPTDPSPDSMPVDSIPVKYLLGQIKPESDSLFVRIEDRYSAGSARGGYLHREAHEAFGRMWAAAQAAGIQLTIRSATRNFWYQQQIWEGKWTGARRVEGQDLSQAIPDPVERARKILRFSSMPGTSRHHWGTDLDLNAFENSYFASGKGLLEYQWLQAHAGEYGFCQVYSAKGEDRPHGYEEEKWHWSYLPVADGYLRAYNGLVTHDLISGFQGAETAEALDVMAHYVNGINPQCIP
jgi:LAS superfamily LD-carboxypeptidase LdcB